MSTVIANKFYTVAEAADVLGLTVQRVRQLIKSEQLVAEKAHDMLWIIPAKALDNFRKKPRPHGVHIDYRDSA
jgi:excisionase family DNA binding protein